MNSKSYEPLQNLSLTKSNELVTAKYKATLLENQIMAIALTRIEAKASNFESTLEAKLYPGELKRLIGDASHIYRTLKVVSKTMAGRTMFIEDFKGNFEVRAIVTDATYVDGVFTVKFNDNLRSHILGLENNYTTLELAVLTDFKRNSSFRIYELLKKEFYKSDIRKNDGRVDVEYRLAEFRFMIGLANADSPSIRNELARAGKNIDWDIVYEQLDKNDRKYKTWYELSRNVLVPAQEELKAKSNIKFEFEGLRSRKGVDRILFHIYPNNAADNEQSKKRQQIIDENKAKFLYNKEKNRDGRQLEFPKDLYTELYDKYVGHNNGLLTENDITLFLKKADMDTEKVKAAIKLADEQEHLNNYIGWVIRAIEKNYMQIETIKGDAELAKDYNEYKKEYENSKDKIAQDVWNNIFKKKEEYFDYVQDLAEAGIDIEQLEKICTSKEMVENFTEWLKERNLSK